MATKKDRLRVLNNWSSAFPDFTMWKDQFLLQRLGPLIRGICLDKTSEKQKYQPTFFFCNLLLNSLHVPLSYAVDLRQRGVGKRIGYSDAIFTFPELFKEQVAGLNSQIGFDSFVEHVQLHDKGSFGPVGVYPPHSLADIITIGSFLGDYDYFFTSLDDSCALLDRKKDNFNMRIIGSIAEWRKTIEEVIKSDGEVIIEKNIQKLELPDLYNYNLSYMRLLDFPAIFK